jgi:hypothetical protein
MHAQWDCELKKIRKCLSSLQLIGWLRTSFLAEWVHTC